MRFKLLLLSMLLAGACHASEIHSDKVKSFAVKPQVCIVEKIGEPCQLATTVSWQTTEVMKVCLLKEQEVMRCWEDTQSIREKLALVLKRSSKVHLVDQKQQMLASELLEVNAVNPKQRRRRLRPAWSLF